MSGPWSWLRRNALLLYAAVAVLYMLLPIIVIGLFSFDQTSTGKLDYRWSGLTLDYWREAFADESVNEAMITSIQLAGLSMLVSTVIGTLMALALVRHQFRGRKASNLLIVLPMATPEIVIGAALLSMFLIYGLQLGFTTLFIAHVMFSISFVVVVVRSRLIGFDRSLEEAAADLGAPPLTTFRTITLPLLAPGIVAAALLAFALSIDDFVISNFNSGTTETFPLYIFGVSLRGIPVQVNVLATLLFLVTVVAIALVLWQQRRAERMAEVRPEPEPQPAVATTGEQAIA
ncbi:MAG TPA: ABC transporter permease [Thermoleophilaceae bacterium]|nr:ABC transporter permease [Thermoleophilaceae bacterium]